MRNIRRLIAIVMATMLFPYRAACVPATGLLYGVFTTEKGEHLRVRLMGDEHFSFWQSDDGRRFILNAEERLCQFNTDEVNSLRIPQVPSQRAPKLGDFKHYEGSYKGIIILAEFTDMKFRETHDKELFFNIANTENFANSMGFQGSVRDYFLSQSRGKFDFSFDVVGPVQLSRSYKYYGEDAGNGSSHNIHAGEMIAEACRLAGDTIDWARYDWDGDGEVEQVFVLFAGEGQHNSTDTYTIWPHKHSLSMSDYGATLQLGDYVIDQYACSSEMHTPTMISGIGVICHEFSHCFGFPEHYDTAFGSSGNFGMYTWDVMGMGNYNGNGFVPAAYTSHERMVLGWLDPIELRDEEVQVEGLRPLSEDGDAYIIYNDANPNEYYLLENRQQVGWDEKLPGRGLLIIHVDFDKSIWEANGVNVTQTSGAFQNTHQRMTIFHADNDADKSDFSLQRDPYPYSKRDSLTDNSIPSAILYTPNLSGKTRMGKPITQIKRNADLTVSFHFGGCTNGIATPVADENAERQKIYRIGGKDVWVPLQGRGQKAARAKYIE